MYGLGPSAGFWLSKIIGGNKMKAMRPLILGLLMFSAGALPAAESGDITNIAQLRQAEGDSAPKDFHIRLEGDVWWADPAGQKFVLHDDSGAAEVEANLTGEFPRAGQRVRVEGDGAIGEAGGVFRLGAIGPVVDNDGVHSMTEKSAAVFLREGKNPLRVDWFNGQESYGLEISWSGPGFPRQRIPGTALFHRPKHVGETNFVSGLDYNCVEADGEMLPDFTRLPSLKTGVVPNFDLGMIPQTNQIGVEFSGWLQAPRQGVYTFFLDSDDGSKLFVGAPTLAARVLGPAEFPAPQNIIPGQIWNGGDDCEWAQAAGTVTFASQNAAGLELELASGVGKMLVEIAGGAENPRAGILGRHARVTGVCRYTVTADGQKIAGMILVPGAEKIEWLDGGQAVANNFGGHLPLLTTCAEVHHLTRGEAELGYPVKIRGVVTSVLPEHQAFTIQDSTRGLYVEDWSEVRSAPPGIGDFLEVEGKTDPSEFAPIVKAARLRNLGEGTMPDAARPTWDQLLNGSLDAQYVELEGIITAVATNGVTLLTRDGRIKLELRVNGMDPAALTNFEDSLVSIRGTLFASWDYVTHEIKAGEIRINGADISVDAPAPADLFALPRETVAELQLFNPQAGVFQRVKVSGQILFAGPEDFMTDGRNGLRFIVKKGPELRAGDLVDVVGFPQLSGISPVLREAVVRKTGHAPLPLPQELPAENPIQGKFDVSRVRIRGVLVSVRETASEQIFELQNGVRSFVARLNGGQFSAPPPGSKLELAGIYSGLGGDKAIGQDISSFELLLNSPGDIKVLSRPPWWTLERLLVIVGALVCGLALTVLWISQLRRKVGQRTEELEIEIRERQRVEHQRAMEQERSRIAQDLHDELGSSLTEITMLGARARSASASAEKRKNYLEEMSEKSRAMVVALDEIVWAMNPRHDSLASLISYFCLYAERFLGLAGIAWHLDDSCDAPETEIDSHCRHQLFLAFKEALTNVVRHSGASEVRLSVSQRNGEVLLTIADNGRGFDPSKTSGGNGIANLSQRLARLGGQTQTESQCGKGTTVSLIMPISAKPKIRNGE